MNCTIKVNNRHLYRYFISLSDKKFNSKEFYKYDLPPNFALKEYNLYRKQINKNEQEPRLLLPNEKNDKVKNSILSVLTGYGFYRLFSYSNIYGFIGMAALMGWRTVATRRSLKNNKLKEQVTQAIKLSQKEIEKGNFQNAANILLQVKSTSSNSEYLNFNIGYLFLLQEQYDEALEYFTKASVLYNDTEYIDEGNYYISMKYLINTYIEEVLLKKYENDTQKQEYYQYKLNEVISNNTIIVSNFLETLCNKLIKNNKIEKSILLNKVLLLNLLVRNPEPNINLIDSVIEEIRRDSYYKGEYENIKKYIFSIIQKYITYSTTNGKKIETDILINKTLSLLAKNDKQELEILLIAHFTTNIVGCEMIESMLTGINDNTLSGLLYFRIAGRSVTEKQLGYYQKSASCFFKAGEIYKYCQIMTMLYGKNAVKNKNLNLVQLLDQEFNFRTEPLYKAIIMRNLGLLNNEKQRCYLKRALKYLKIAENEINNDSKQLFQFKNQYVVLCAEELKDLINMNKKYCLENLRN